MLIDAFNKDCFCSPLKLCCLLFGCFLNNLKEHVKILFYDILGDLILKGCSRSSGPF